MGGVEGQVPGDEAGGRGDPRDGEAAGAPRPGPEGEGSGGAGAGHDGVEDDLGDGKQRHCSAEGRRGRRGCWRWRGRARLSPSGPTGSVPVPGRSRLSRSTSGKRRSKPTFLWVIDNDRATAWSAWIT